MYTEEQMKSFENKILNMDCLDFLKKCPDNYFSLVLTDPPYGIGVNNMHLFDGSKKQQRHKEYEDIAPDKIYFEELFRVSQNQIIWGGNYFYLPPTRCNLIWDKIQDFSGADFELAWTSFNKPSKIFRMSRIEAYGKGTIHSTQKPLKLFEWCLQNHSNENDLVLDCFSGSGTTAIACHNLKRRFICIEKDKDYYEASCKRLEEHQRQYTLF